MYNINSHYKFIIEFSKKTNAKKIKLAYFFPFGATQFKNIEFVGDEAPDVFLLCYDQEPINLNYNRSTFNQFDELTWNGFDNLKKAHTCFSKTLNEYITVYEASEDTHKKIPTILLNTEKDSDQKNKVLEHYNYIDCYCFYHALAASDWFRGYQYSYNILPIRERKIKKTFITFNRITGNSRIYRAFFVSLLAEKNLLKHGHISFSKECPVHGNLTPSIIDAIKKYDLPKELFLQTKNTLSTLSTLRIDTPHTSDIQNFSFTVEPITQSMESFVYVVTETCFWDKKKHLTEKIFKPIVLKQPFILVGCAYNLDYLKEYGFKTFDRWWDESYDNCEDPIERLNLIVKILEDLSKLSDQELFSMLCDMEEILEHNYSLFFSKEFIDLVWRELEINLTTAFSQLLPQTSQEI